MKKWKKPSFVCWGKAGSRWRVGERIFPDKTLAKKTHPEIPHTVDGKNPANQLRLVVYPIIYMVLYIPGGSPDF